MKIGFDAKRLFCNRTGLGNYSRTIVSNYADYCPEDELYLYSPKDKNLEDSIKFKTSNKFKTVFNSSLFWRSRRIIKDLKRDQIQIFHGLSNELPFGIHKSGIKSVVTIHDLIFKVYPKTYPLIDRIIYDLKVRYACKYSDTIIAISESTKQDIIKYYNINEDKINVIPQTTLPEYWENNDLNIQKSLKKEFNLNTDFFISVGTIEERKNLKSVLIAFSEVKSKIPLVIIGNGKSYKQEILQVIKDLNLSQWVYFIPRRISNLELKNIYSLAKFSIYLSIYEGFGLPVLESRLSGTPVITSNTSSLPEAAGSESKCISPTDKNTLIKTISEFISSDLEKKSRQTKTSAQSLYNKNKLNQQLNSLYYKLLNK